MTDFEREQFKKRAAELLEQARNSKIGENFLDQCILNGDVGMGMLMSYLTGKWIFPASALRKMGVLV